MRSPIQDRRLTQPPLQRSGGPGRAGSPLHAETMARTGVTRRTWERQAFDDGSALLSRRRLFIESFFDYDYEQEHASVTHLRIMMRQFVS